MAIPAPLGVGAAGIPPAGDQANAVVVGSFTAAGPSAPFAFYGAFNVVIWGTVSATLTTTANSSNASVSSGTAIVAGQTVKSVNVPRGTTWQTFSGTSGVLAFPPGFTNANVISGADASAVFGTAVWDGTVALERSFDGCQTFQTCNVGGAGQPAIYLGSSESGSAVSFVAAEPERQVFYRVNCSVYGSGTINYRVSTNGLAAMAWGVPMG